MVSRGTLFAVFSIGGALRCSMLFKQDSIVTEGAQFIREMQHHRLRRHSSWHWTCRTFGGELYLAPSKGIRCWGLWFWWTRHDNREGKKHSFIILSLHCGFSNSLLTANRVSKSLIPHANAHGIRSVLHSSGTMSWTTWPSPKWRRNLPLHMEMTANPVIKVTRTREECSSPVQWTSALGHVRYRERALFLPAQHYLKKKTRSYPNPHP